MEGEEDNSTNGKNQRKEEDNTASRTGEECLEDADAFNAMTEEGGAASDDEDYFDDTSFDAELDHLDWDAGDDPFDAREWQIIRNNLEP